MKSAAHAFFAFILTTGGPVTGQLPQSTLIVPDHPNFCRVMPAFAHRICHGLAMGLLYFSANMVCAESLVKPPQITIVQSEADGSYAEFGAALKKILGRKGLTPVLIDASQTIPDSGLVIAVGIKAATAAAISNAPAVLNVFITKAGHEKLLRDFPRAYVRSAIFMDQPVNRLARLIAAIYPGKRNVGLLYSSLPADLAEFRTELAAHGLKLQEQAVNPSFPLAVALQDVLRKSDMLLVMPDTEIYNSSTIRNILMATYRSNIPVIGILLR